MESPTIPLADGTNVALVTVKSLKKGEYFKRIIGGKLSNETYTRDDYDRSAKRFAAEKHSDVWGNGILLKGSVLVTTQFTY